MVGYETSMPTLDMSTRDHMSRSNMAAYDFDEVFDQMEGEPQPREVNQNGLPPNREIVATDQMRVSWDIAFAYQTA